MGLEKIEIEGIFVLSGRHNVAGYTKRRRCNEGYVGLQRTQADTSCGNNLVMPSVGGQKRDI